MSNFDKGDMLCEVCGCWATRFFGNFIPLCDNRVCEQVLIDEAIQQEDDEGEQS